MDKKPALFERESYLPNHWFDWLMLKLNVKSDAALARALQVPPSTISKVRNKHMPINSSLLLSAHELTEISIRDLRALMGDTHTRYWQGEIRNRAGDRQLLATGLEESSETGEAQHEKAPAEVLWAKGGEKFARQADSAL